MPEHFLRALALMLLIAITPAQAMCPASPTSCTLDLSSIEGFQKATDASSQFDSLFTVPLCGPCPSSIGYYMSQFSGQSPCNNLAGHPNGNNPQIVLRASNDKSCIQAYSITFHYIDKTVTPNVQSAGFTATFHYVTTVVTRTCATATFLLSSNNDTNPFSSTTIGTAYTGTTGDELFATDLPGCALTISYTTSPSFSKLTTTVLSDGKMTISVDGSTVSGEEGNKTITTVSCITANPTQCKSEVWTVTITSPCQSAIFTTEGNDYSGTGLSTTIGTPQTFTPDVYLFVTIPAGCALTNTFTTSPNFSKLTAAVLSDGRMQISMAANTVSGEEGDKTINVTSCITSNPTVCKSKTVTVNLLVPCSQTTVTGSNLQDQSRVVWQAAISYTIPVFKDSDSVAAGNPILCPKTYSFTYSPTIAAGVTLPFSMTNSSTPSFFIESNNMNQIGNYSVTVTAKVTAYPTRYASQQFYINITDPCLTTTLIVPSTALSLMTAVVNIPSVQQVVSTFNDSVSVRFGSGSGDDICGPRTYSISTVPTGTASPMEIGYPWGIWIHASKQITLQIRDQSNVGTHTATVSVNLTNYPLVTAATQAFQINVQHCILQSFTTTNPPDLTYTITDSKIYPAVNTGNYVTQVPQCGYDYTVKISNLPTFSSMNASGTTVNCGVQGNLRSQIGTYNISFKLDIIGYPYTPIPSTTQYQTLVALDPCNNTIVSGSVFDWPNPTIKNFVQFAGYSLTSSESININDTISEYFTQSTDPVDFCGIKTISFQISNQTTTWLSGKNGERITFSPPSTTTQFGTYPSIFLGCLQDYPTVVCNETYFNITILGSKTPTLPNQQYQIGNSALNISIGKFEILPSDLLIDPPLEISYNAYILAANATLATPIDLKSQYLTIIQNQAWIKFDSQTISISVKTQDTQLVGNYTVVVVQNFREPVGVNPFITFNLILSAFVSSQTYKVPTAVRSPYFNPSLSSQTVNQCPENSNNSLWTFQIPKPVDYNNATVAIEVFLNQVYFTFDYVSNTIKQIQGFTPPGEQAFNIILTNSQNVTANYNFKVNFVCQVQSASQQSSFIRNFIGNVTLLQKKQTLANLQGFKPAWVSDINQIGQVKIKFFHDVIVPKFTNQQLSSLNQSHQRALSNDFNLTLQQFVDNSVLRVKQIMKGGNITVNWTCISLQNKTLTLQLNFDRPLEVSLDTPDLLTVQFMQPDLFILTTKTDYLFNNETQQTLQFTIPPQFPSESSQKLFQTLAKVASDVSTTTIVISIVIQVVAKKVISSLFEMYIMIQIILLVCLKCGINLPASVDLLLTTVNGIISLSSFDKQAIIEDLNLPVSLLEKDKLLSNLGGISFIIALLFLIIAIVLIISYLLRNKKGMLMELVTKMKKKLFWNFIIRYIQVAFINLNYSALKSVTTSKAQMEMITSSNILAILYLIVICICYITLTKPRFYLEMQSTREAIGNMYQNLSCQNRYKIMYGPLFFIQRIFVVLIIVLVQDFCVQWILVYVSVFAKAMYLLRVDPYQVKEDGTSDYLNTIILLILIIFWVSVSPFIPNAQERYQNGIYFDIVFGIALLLNVFLVISRASHKIKLKLMQLMQRRQVRNEKLKIKKEVEKKAIEDEVQLRRQDEMEKARAARESNMLRVINSYFPQQQAPVQQFKPNIPLPTRYQEPEYIHKPSIPLPLEDPTPAKTKMNKLMSSFNNNSQKGQVYSNGVESKSVPQRDLNQQQNNNFTLSENLHQQEEQQKKNTSFQQVSSPILFKNKVPNFQISTDLGQRYAQPQNQKLIQGINHNFVFTNFAQEEQQKQNTFVNLESHRIPDNKIYQQLPRKPIIQYLSKVDSQNRPVIPPVDPKYRKKFEELSKVIFYNPNANTELTESQKRNRALRQISNQMNGDYEVNKWRDSKISMHLDEETMDQRIARFDTWMKESLMPGICQGMTLEEVYTSYFTFQFEKEQQLIESKKRNELA